MEFIVLYLFLSIAIGGGIGYLIGQSKGNATAGFWLGALLGFIGWIIVAVMEPSAEERQRRQAELAGAVLEAGSPAAAARAAQVAERPCPFCAELIKPAAIVCRFCGRDVPVWTAPPFAATATQSPQAEVQHRSPADFDAVRTSYPRVFDAVWAAAQDHTSWPAFPEPALRDACRRAMQGQATDVAVRKAFPKVFDGPAFDGPAY